MKSIIKRFALFALMLAMFGQYTTVQAGDVFKFKGRSASAFFESIDASGCIITGGSVFVSQQVFHNPPGGGIPSAEVFIDLFQFDFCTDTPLLSASGNAPLAKPDFQVDGTLASAALNATVNMFDFVLSSSFDVTVDLNWTATSSLGHQNSRFNVTFQGCHENLHTNSAFRFAEASGSISDGTTNFTPLPSLDGQILSAKTGDVSHGCN